MLDKNSLPGIKGEEFGKWKTANRDKAEEKYRWGCDMKI